MLHRCWTSLTQTCGCKATAITIIPHLWKECPPWRVSRWPVPTNITVHRWYKSLTPDFMAMVITDSDLWPRPLFVGPAGNITDTSWQTHTCHQPTVKHHFTNGVTLPLASLDGSVLLYQTVISPDPIIRATYVKLTEPGKELHMRTWTSSWKTAVSGRVRAAAVQFKMLTDLNQLWCFPRSLWPKATLSHTGGISQWG